MIDMIRTLGHGTLALDAFVALVKDSGIDVVVDVRRFPGSRRHPHFAREAMSAWLPQHGIGYHWLVDLGGRRKPVPDSRNAGLRNAQFRAYGDYMASARFAAAVTDLRALSSRHAAAVMCAESVWWRCHRRLLADHLVLIEGMRVEHLFHDGRTVEHATTPEARVYEGHVVYDAGTLESGITPD